MVQTVCTLLHLSFVSASKRYGILTFYLGHLIISYNCGKTHISKGLSCKHNNNFFKSSTNRKLSIHHCISRGQKECHCKCRRMWWRFATEIAGCKVSGTSARVSWSLGTLAGMAMVQQCHLYLENRLCQVCGHLRRPPRLRLEV